MAEKIKGLTLEIGGDTTALTKALSGVNKTTKDLQGELKNVERLLKLDPKNTELLSQKQKILAESVSTAREKLDTLKEAERQAQEQFKQGKISEEQYRALQREVIKTEQDLKKFESQLAEVTKTTKTWREQLDRTSDSLKNAGKKMTEAGKNLTMKVTAPIAAIGAVAAKTGMDFEAAMSEVGAISGATGKDLEALEAKAKEMGATTKFSASQSAEALKYMAMAGWDTTKMLDGLSGVMNLAAASGEELGSVSDIVTDAMTAFGMEANRANEFADVLAATSSKANTNVSMLGESFKYVAPVAGALGYSAQDTAVALGLMANAGIKGSQSGAALRATISRLVKPTKESGTSMNQLGISMLDSEGKMKSLAEIIGDLRSSMKDLDPDQQAFHAAQIAGQEAMSGLLAIVNTSEEDYNKLSNAINNADGTAQKMADTMQDNLAGKLTLLKSALEGVAIQIYDALQPALEILVAIIQKAVDAFANLSPGMQATIVIIAGIAAAIGPLLIVLGMMASGLGAIITLVPTIVAAGTALGTAFTVMLGPIGFVVAAIAAMIAIGVLLYKNWDEKKKKLSEIWDGIKKTAENIWNGLKSFFADWGKTILLMTVGPAGWAVLLAQKLGENWDSIKQTATNIWSSIQGSLSGIWNNILSTASSVWARVKEAIIRPIESAKQVLFGIIQSIKDAFSNMRIEIPRPKLPHINVDWKSYGIGDAKISIPKFSLNWYSKGGIFGRPSIIGVGEAGKEAVIPLDKLPGLIAGALRDAMGGGQVAMAGGITVQNMYVRNDQDIKLVARELYNLQQQNARGRGLT